GELDELLVSSGPGRLTWDHQSHDAMPGLTHEASAMTGGDARFSTRSLSTRRPGWRAMMKVRQGEWRGKLDLTRPRPSVRGESLAARVIPPSLPAAAARFTH